jgi:hypothetical protein
MKTSFGDNFAWLEHDGVIRETDKAKCFLIENEEIWIPKSLIKDENEELVAVPQWFAKKNGLESDW